MHVLRTVHCAYTTSHIITTHIITTTTTTIIIITIITTFNPPLNPPLNPTLNSTLNPILNPAPNPTPNSIMGDGALGSDHINYLILRYLQESGHENAAKALLSQDWSRPDEYRDPEKLPFAPKVKQYDLVNIIQDGLFHDQLQAQVTKQPQRFDLIAVHSTTLNTNTNTTTTSSTADPDTVSASRSAQKHPHPQSQQPQQSQQNCYSHSQPSRRRSTPPPRPTGTAAAAAAAADHDDFPLPASKRARKTTENDDDDDNDDDHDHDHAHAHAHARGPSNHVNGDAMDLDLNALPSADDVRSDQDNPTDNDRTMSDHPDTAHSTSSPPPRPPVVETSSAATQTDKKIKPLNSETLYWSIDADGASIMHAIWNPNPDMAARLLTVGESLCRFHTLPDQHPQSLDTTNGDTDKIKVCLYPIAYFCFVLLLLLFSFFSPILTCTHPTDLPPSPSTPSTPITSTSKPCPGAQ